MRAIIVFGICFFTVAAVLLTAPQTAGAVSFLAGGGFEVGAPKGEFKDNIDRNGYGVGFEGMIFPSAFPFGFGLELGFMNYGHKTRTAPISTTIPDLKVRVENNNNIFNGNFMLRVMPVRYGWVRPYVDGLLGFKYLFTDTSIRDVDSLGGDDIASSTNFDDFTSAYGIGGGMLFKVWTFENLTHVGQRGELFIDFNVRYMNGGKAEYLREGSLRTENGKVEYDVSKSETDMLMFHIGVAFGF